MSWPPPRGNCCQGSSPASHESALSEKMLVFSVTVHFISTLLDLVWLKTLSLCNSRQLYVNDLWFPHLFTMWSWCTRFNNLATFSPALLYICSCSWFLCQQHLGRRINLWRCIEMLFHRASVFACGARRSTQQAWVLYIVHHGGCSLLWSSHGALRIFHFSLSRSSQVGFRAHRLVCAFQIDCINQTNWKPAAQTGQLSVSIRAPYAAGVSISDPVEIKPSCHRYWV